MTGNSQARKKIRSVMRERAKRNKKDVGKEHKEGDRHVRERVFVCHA